MEDNLPGQLTGGKPLILFIDAYDSFSNNIISLLETTLNASVRTVKIDNPLLQHDGAFHQELQYYTAVVCGPGPGHPEKKEDVGVMDKIWALSDRHMLPVLGICLGFQSLCKYFGGEVLRLKGPQHGIIRRVTHIGESDGGKGTIYEGIGEVHATHYQSLCMDIGHGYMPKQLFQSEKWESTSACTDLLPLAWAEWDGNEDNNSGMKDERILVAVQHKTKPFWALQYHPESICTNEESRKTIQNWAQQVYTWNRSSRQSRIKNSSEGDTIGMPNVRESLLSSFEQISSSSTSAKLLQSSFGSKKKYLEWGLDHVYQCHTVKLPEHIAVADIMEVVQGSKRDQILLESSNAHEIDADVKGRYSIIGMDITQGLRFDYTTGTDNIRVCQSDGYPGGGGEFAFVDLQPYGGVWPFLADFMEKRKIYNGNPESPFWGGFMGYTTYEMGLEGIEVERFKSRAESSSPKLHPDLSFAWVTRSLVLDHDKRLVYIQGISKKSSEKHMPQWMVHAALKLGALCVPNAKYYLPHLTLPELSEDEYSSSRSSTSPLEDSGSTESPALPSGARSSTYSIESTPEITSHQSSITSVKTPIDVVYEGKVSLCQDFISSGDSYELCLTDETTVIRPRFDSYWAINWIDPKDYSTNADSWSLYRTLRTRQPAPFASYLRLGPATLVSASPERFLSWTADGKCELRPMKGTVRKSSEVSTLKQAKALLDVPKEKAENLMIVDLVRHDLHGVCGSGDVTVPRLMVVEEYKSVFQMISVVQGQIPQPPSSSDPQPNSRYTGIDVLAASLPPGSMTGAPKKRSCELLRDIETRERGMYSGVVGYMDVGGRGDFSVTIRCMFRWDDEHPWTEEKRNEGDLGVETWHIGAGGAVTTLSTPEGEREEMQTKLSGTLGLFA